MKRRHYILLSFFLFSLNLFGKTESDTIASETLDEIVVTAVSAAQRMQNPIIGAERLELAALSKVPAMGGENDIIKAISLLAGVRSEGDGGGGFEVRGGNASQNLVLLDGITLYNPSHVMGIFSTFNDKALASATLFKGPFPAFFGGASSSVLETGLTSGDMNRYHAGGTVGILAAKLNFSGPVIKNKLAVAVTGRRSYVDAFLQLVPKYRKTVMNFYDVTAKLRWKPAEGNIVDGSFFMSRDNLAISNVMGMYWGNIGASLSWRNYNADNFSSDLNLSLTHYDPKMEMSIMNLDQSMKTFIRSYSANERLSYRPSENQSLEFGLRTELFRVKSGEWSAGTSREIEIRSLSENSVWASWEVDFLEKINLSAGLRFVVSSVLHSEKFNEYSSVSDEMAEFRSKSYFDIQPRLSIKYNLSPLHNLKAGFGSATQNLHSIRSTTTSFPFDRYALTSYNVKPERAIQYGVGYAGMTEDGGFDWSAELYWRDIDNIYDYRDGATAFSSINLESVILGGRGRSYGAEFMLRKNCGPLTGWISYTISQTRTRIAGINGGKWYNASNDRRNDLAITATYQFNSKWSASASWIFTSGCPLTAPDVKYELSGITCYYYSQRNGYKTPPVHRLDLGAVYTHAGRKLTYEWAFGLYNAYCRYNPYVIYFEDDSSKPSGSRAVIRALYGLIPSVSYTLSF